MTTAMKHPIGREPWRARAACRTENPELFFPVGQDAPAKKQTTEAKIVCLRCPVRTDCLRHALKTGEAAGVWGGASESERRQVLVLLRRKTRAEQAARQQAQAG